MSHVARRFPRWLIAAPLALVAVWVLLLDSHSVLRRVQWARELSQLEANNRRLQEEIESLEQQIPHAHEPEVVERIAREQYGMRRPGETVYRVEEEP
ncbi:MAG TPA: septum formation initiator family protein [Rhodothermales bacterium]|nr:septum formation initiator family protein [Rhodothermales bacterium]